LIDLVGMGELTGAVLQEARQFTVVKIVDR
jgi:hypothetical protein